MTDQKRTPREERWEHLKCALEAIETAIRAVDRASIRLKAAEFRSPFMATALNALQKDRKRLKKATA